MRNRYGEQKDENYSKHSEFKTPQRNEDKARNTQVPIYSNELSINQNETLEKIEEFRKARKTWIESNAHEEIITDVHEDTHKTDLHKGRCNCLRRISFKAMFLRSHRKTVRPTRLFSRKSILSNWKVKKSPTQSHESINSALSIKKEQDYGFYPVGDSSFSNFGSVISEKSHPIKISTRSNESSRKAFKPSKKAIKKLKDAKKNADTESYACTQERDLTVLLNNVCPNYKKVIKRSKIKKVDDGYNGLTDEDEERVLCQPKDSIEIYKKKVNKKQTCTDDVIGKHDSKVSVGSVKSEEAIFSQLKDSLEIHQRKMGRKKIHKKSQENDKGEALSKAHKEEKHDRKDKDEDDGKKVSLITLYEDSGRGFTKEELIKMGRMYKETITVKL